MVLPPPRPRVFGSFLALALAGASMAGCGHSPAQAAAPEEQRALPVASAPVQRELLQRSTRVPGILQSNTELDLSFKVPGVIKRVAVEEGAQVKRGQLLAVLDPTELAAGSAQATEALSKAERDVARARSLHASGGVPRNTLDDAETALVIAREGSVSASFNLRHSELRAPFDGIIERRSLELGEVVAPTQPVMHLRALGGSEVKVALVDREALALAPGHPTTVTLDARPGEALRARVKRVATSATPGTGTFDVELALDDVRARALPSGLTVKVTFARSEPALTVPLLALVDGDGLDAQLFVIEGERARRKKVRVDYIEGDRAALLTGPAVGTRVVAAGAGELRDGARVRVVGGE